MGEAKELRKLRNPSRSERLRSFLDQQERFGAPRCPIHRLPSKTVSYSTSIAGRVVRCEKCESFLDD